MVLIRRRLQRLKHSWMSQLVSLFPKAVLFVCMQNTGNMSCVINSYKLISLGALGVRWVDENEAATKPYAIRYYNIPYLEEN